MTKSRQHLLTCKFIGSSEQLESVRELVRGLSLTRRLPLIGFEGHQATVEEVVKALALMDHVKG